QSLDSINKALKTLGKKKDELLSASYEIQDKIHKTNFAYDVLNASNDSWCVPTYIREGLVWLAL
ncbi:MAG: hypothetical protein U1C51_09590, partial [Candidatus Izemoplasmatales bacterium]|nr:hypothetical protein [Candidatus Izemoplasmatales bacterium]